MTLICRGYGELQDMGQSAAVKGGGLRCDAAWICTYTRRKISPSFVEH
jgi:hypothetical protein